MRDLTRLYGHGDAEQAFLAASQTGRLHHGWLLEGPSGIGKAQLALRLAVRLLGGDPDNAADQIAGLVLGGVHPDLRWLQRQPDEKGKLPLDIPVREARELTRFFELRPAMGGARIGIIDSVDELNRFGANALLKTLEEPPRGAVLFLIHHGARPILPTIRSRCRVLKLHAIDDTSTRDVLDKDAPEGWETVASLVPGRPGKIANLASAEARQAIAAAAVIRKEWPRPSDTSLGLFASRAGDSVEAVEAGLLALQDWFADEARKATGQAQQKWSSAWLDLVRKASEARDLAMEPRQVSHALMKTVFSLVETR